MYKIACARAKWLFVNINILFFAILLAVAVVVGFAVVQKKGCHGNVTSHFSSLLSHQTILQLWA